MTNEPKKNSRFGWETEKELTQRALGCRGTESSNSHLKEESKQKRLSEGENHGAV